jgi:hypothetical protein
MKFQLGQCVATRNAAALMAKQEVNGLDLLRRHARGDWGDVCKADKASNDAAVLNGDRILSAYKTSHGDRLWVITEWDRSVTTILLPEDY